MKMLGFAGYSGSGKTTLIEALLPRFKARGLKVSVIKQTHHDIEFDTPGKDSWRHRQAGAHEVMLTSPRRWMLTHELGAAPEPTFDELVARLSPCDLVLVEGFRHGALPRIEVWRKVLGHPRLHPDTPGIVALAGDARDHDLPCFPLDDLAGIERFILTILES